jgi:hypothetical protein
MDNGYILLLFGIFSVIWYFFHVLVCCMYQEKSGNLATTHTPVVITTPSNATDAIFCCLDPGWPNTANFRKILSECLLLEVKNCRCSPHFWATFFHGKKYSLALTKNVLGYITDDFFKHSSGHPAWVGTGRYRTSPQTMRCKASFTLARYQRLGRFLFLEFTKTHGLLRNRIVAPQLKSQHPTRNALSVDGADALFFFRRS